MMQALKEKIASSRVKRSIDSSIGLKFAIPITAVVCVLMICGSLFVAEIALREQNAALDLRGRELGALLGKAASGLLLEGNFSAVDQLAAEAAQSDDIVYVYVTDGGGAIVTTPQGSFNRKHPLLRASSLFSSSSDVRAIVDQARARIDVVETVSGIGPADAGRSTVTIGFDRSVIAGKKRNLLLLLLGTSAVIVVLLLLFVSSMVRKMILTPATEAVSVASNIASGDLSRTVQVKSVDEMGMLGRGLNRMIIGLKGIIGNMIDTSKNLDRVSESMSQASSRIAKGSRVQFESVEEAASSINEMHFALKEIAATVEGLNATSAQTSSAAIQTGASVGEVERVTAELSASIEVTASSIAQMSASVRQIADNIEILSHAASETAASAVEISTTVREVESSATQSAALAETVADDAEHLGMEAIRKTIEGMNRIAAAAQGSAEAVNRLGDRAESIGGILTVIEDITDQTGLLALNAAILAAQAGEHGKGFAVVAAEIRELAKRTARSTGAIGNLIGSVQEDTQAAVAAMREGVGIVQEGTQVATEAGQALKTILDRAVQARDMSRGISRASAEQAKGVKQVSGAVERISDMAQQIARALNEQKAGTEQITQAAEKMREMTQFVKNATCEQASASREITTSVESVHAKIGLVNRSTTELRAGSDLIVHATNRIKEIAKENAELSAALNGTVEALSAQAALLRKETGKFTI